ncbi:MAG: DUF5615 family PIN-like protein [Spirochaetaceae bacterium]|nr:DUF5615 family PIN-like protein [Spirochaetaceae bacterium]
MRFLIDECLSPDLTEVAWNAGFDCAHVARVGRDGGEDWQHMQHAISDDWVLVTNDTTDFVTLVGREEMHPGLVCLNFADGHNTLDSQKRLFRHALKLLADLDPVNEVLEVTLSARGRVITERYRWPLSHVE